jgi:hypothetical protein
MQDIKECSLQPAEIHDVIYLVSLRKLSARAEHTKAL